MYRSMSMVCEGHGDAHAQTAETRPFLLFGPGKEANGLPCNIFYTNLFDFGGQYNLLELLYSKEHFIQYMIKGFRLSIAQQHFQSCDLVCTYYFPSMWYSTARSGSPQDALHLH